MKLFLTLVLGIFLASAGQAQISWDYAKPDTVYSFEINPDVEVHNNITFSDSGTYRWVRQVVTGCDIGNAICDKNQCYLEHVDSAIFVVEKDETFPMLCHFYPYDKCCKHAKVILKVYKLADPSVFSVAEYNIVLWCSSASVPGVQSNLLKVYPNPANDVLKISSNNQLPSEVSILDIHGRNVAKARVNDGQISIGDLGSGTYFIEYPLNSGVMRQRFIKL